MYRYIVFDVETPNRNNDRMSAIGIAVVENGAVTKEFFSYVDPETRFDSFNTKLTGISKKTVEGAPNFPQLWEKIEPLMSSGILAAHNAVFDLGVLKKCLKAYGIEWQPDVKYCCTVQMGRRLLKGMPHGLDALCGHYGIPLDHHKADSDSRACAEILLRFFAEGAQESEHIRTFKMA